MLDCGRREIFRSIEGIGHSFGFDERKIPLHGENRERTHCNANYSGNYERFIPDSIERQRSQRVAWLDLMINTLPLT